MKKVLVFGLALLLKEMVLKKTKVKFLVEAIERGVQILLKLPKK